MAAGWCASAAWIIRRWPDPGWIRTNGDLDGDPQGVDQRWSREGVAVARRPEGRDWSPCWIAPLAATSGPSTGNLPGPTYPRCMPRGMPPSHRVAPDLGLFARGRAQRPGTFPVRRGGGHRDGAFTGRRVVAAQRARRVDPQADTPPLVWDARELEEARNPRRSIGPCRWSGPCSPIRPPPVDT